MELLHQFLAVFHDLPGTLNLWSAQLGSGLYAVLFAIIFAETGLIVFPLLPGDSLLFAVGALAAIPGSEINIAVLCVVLSLAAVAGDAVNYSVGHFLRHRLRDGPRSRFIKKEHLDKTQSFYDRYGGKTILLARFIPIIRTYAPFVAGMAKMRYRNFAVFNISGGIAWIVLFLGAGYFFGNLPAVRSNFHLVIFAIIVISILPPVFEWLKARRAISNGRGGMRGMK
jgi:membrane-associated protein